MRNFAPVSFVSVFLALAMVVGCEGGQSLASAHAKVNAAGDNADAGSIQNESGLDPNAKASISPSGVPEEADAGVTQDVGTAGGTDQDIGTQNGTDATVEMDTDVNGQTDATAVITPDAGSGSTDAGSNAPDVDAGQVEQDSGSTQDTGTNGQTDAGGINYPDTQTADTGSGSTDAGQVQQDVGTTQDTAQSGTDATVEMDTDANGQTDATAVITPDAGSSSDTGGSVDTNTGGNTDAGTTTDTGGGNVDPCAGKSCDDGNVCTTDTCQGGLCVNTVNSASCLTGGVCVVGSCFVGDSSCDDGNPCTYDDFAAKAGCFHVNLDVACEDGNVCTVGDSCSAGACVPGAAKDCSDGNVCTLDTCDAVTGCSNPLATPTYAEDWNTFTSKDDMIATQLGQGWSGTGSWNVKCGGFPYGQGAVFTGCTTWFGDNNITGEVHVQHGLTGVGTARTLQLDVQRIGNDPSNASGLTLYSGVRFFDAEGGVISTVPFAFTAKEYDVYQHVVAAVPFQATSFHLYVKRTAELDVQAFYEYSVRFDNIKVWPLQPAAVAACFK